MCPDEIKHKREMEKIKTQQRKTFDWTTFTVIILVCGTILFSVFLLSLGLGVANAVGPLNTILDKNPELALGYAFQDHLDEDIVAYVLGLEILKQMQLDGEVDFNFQVDFTTKTVRYLEKKDLTCVDEYTYKKINKSNFVSAQRLKDNKCIWYAFKKPYDYYKCPRFNCERIEKTRIIHDEVIPKYFEINRIKTSVGGD